MTMTSSELLPSVMSATLLQEAGVTLSALRATFSATHPSASKAMTNSGCGRGNLPKPQDSVSGMPQATSTSISQADYEKVKPVRPIGALSANGS
ncbi:hypothetical protein pfor_22c2424 [Rhodobacteraceae bacterium SB2]|nr:hypothetical protein pfor_22c2424 [Rhodobacteraceae bacterium SB2]